MIESTQDVAARVQVGPFQVADLSRSAVVDALSGQPGRRVVAYALHIGGLNDRGDQRFVDTMNAADFTYADGAAVVLLAKLAGAREMERSATTDIGLVTIKALGEGLGRKARVALIGGPPELVERARPAIEERAGAVVVYATHGYHDDYATVLGEIRLAKPDVLIVGMGMPREALWVESYRHDLPQALILTCGGWLGFLAGDEVRAPGWMQRSGLEWMYRLSQAPTRLFRRYALGIATVCALVPEQFVRSRESR
ncbi:WecB/TagA/CpsF family glycosyltransferase [Agromyces albus]|uniref:WecB/TagA/CpsF family glycosyltransferase n=1 Tax=Agromyces albus TaxID=205332 RepID=UPI00278ACD4C|nr:WecB/TagA/CpsF family glycosyltransferase [Agromyces albus]MDQ0574558.1 N-acetylglucosaminyldiphosphoundecaprenol N-acetyl-beta-D-mannosaminyltransferase [Agromyces albus]